MYVFMCAHVSLRELIITLRLCSWENSAAWVMCSVDADWCTGVDVPLAPAVRAAAWNYSAVVKGSREGGDGLDLWHGHQFCFVATLGQALPWFLVMLAVLYVLFQCLKLPFVFMLASTQFLVQAVSFTHAE